MTELSKKALDEFLGEAQEILEGLNSDLLVLDEGNKEGKMDPETMNNIFRGVHSLKGLAGMFGMDKLSNFAHHLENLLDAMRLGKVRISPDMLDILFEALEIFNQLTDEISKSVDQGVEIDEVNVDPLLEKISDASNQSVEDDGGEILDLLSLAPNLLESLMEYERFRLKENLRQKNKVFSGALRECNGQQRLSDTSFFKYKEKRFFRNH